MNKPSGKLKGKAMMHVSWSKLLAKYPELRFEKRHVWVGAGSFTLIYSGVRGLSAEVFHFDPQGKVYAAYIHYEL
ncbi:MAG: hypothetical protein KIH69_011375 [Anaerolineae bacterium]|nr:hypothetical protein [Anaerolineae bacterium]